MKHSKKETNKRVSGKLFSILNKISPLLRRKQQERDLERGSIHNLYFSLISRRRISSENAGYRRYPKQKSWKFATVPNEILAVGEGRIGKKKKLTACDTLFVDYSAISRYFEQFGRGIERG